MQGRSAAELYVPSVAYDPTNGVVSSGDIFFRLPPRNVQ